MALNAHGRYHPAVPMVARLGAFAGTVGSMVPRPAKISAGMLRDHFVPRVAKNHPRGVAAPAHCAFGQARS
jgi:hypothetical protein